jgi:mannose-6-phosphate isomerase-like protein (cupin superfamily)
MKMAEIYFILEGEGKLYHGMEALNVGKGAHLTLNPFTPHKLRNTGPGRLEHLVLAIPPFDPADVFLLENPNLEPGPETYERKEPPITALDGATIYELLSKEERLRLGIGLAIGSLPPGRKAIPHYHETSDEIYYIMSGKGRAKIDPIEIKIRKGYVVCIPKTFVHSLENTSDSEELEVLCISSPAYTDEDFIKAE